MKNPSMKNFSLQDIYIIITKQNEKWKYYDFARAINCIRKLTCVCVCVKPCAIERREQCKDLKIACVLEHMHLRLFIIS